MAQYINKAALIAEIKRRIKEIDEMGTYLSPKGTLTNLLCSIDTLEVKDDSLEKFKSLQHISGDLHKTLVEDWGYAPNLYHFDESWHVDWISCEEGDSIKGFTADTPEEAINKAFNWFHSTFCKG